MDLGGSVRILKGRLVMFDYVGRLISVPEGFRTDFASIPSIARTSSIVLAVFQLLAMSFSAWFYAGEVAAILCIFMAEWIENTDTDEIATVHDWLFKTGMVGFNSANLVLFYGMKAKNSPRNSLLKRLIFLFAVTIFGWPIYLRYRLAKTGSQAGRFST